MLEYKVVNRVGLSHSLSYTIIQLDSGLRNSLIYLLSILSSESYIFGDTFEYSM